MKQGEIVQRLIKPEIKIQFAREIKILKSLQSEYDDMTFWANFDPGFKLNSLAFFKTERGIDLLAKLYFDWKEYKKKENAEYSPTPAADSSKVTLPTRKHHNLLDYI